MKIQSALPLIAALTLALSACSENQPNASSAPSTTPANTAATSTPTATPTETPVPSQTPTPQPTPVASQGFTYRMNKNFDIVPKDEQDNKKVVLLTFDDGPKEQAMLESLLNTLDKHNAKAIFFMNGYRIKQKPELLKLIHDRGQVLGNHSWDHIDLKKESADNVEKQIGDVQAIVKEVTGEAPRFFRPPFGSGGDIVKQTAQKHDLLFMTWSNGSLDWEMTNKKNDPEKVIENVIKQLHPGSNILMHELPWTASALDKLLNELAAKGYSFVDPNLIDPQMP